MLAFPLLFGFAFLNPRSVICFLNYILRSLGSIMMPFSSSVIWKTLNPSIWNWMYMNRYCFQVRDCNNHYLFSKVYQEEKTSKFLMMHWPLLQAWIITGCRCEIVFWYYGKDELVSVVLSATLLATQSLLSDFILLTDREKAQCVMGCSIIYICNFTWSQLFQIRHCKSCLKYLLMCND